MAYANPSQLPTGTSHRGRRNQSIRGHQAKPRQSTYDDDALDLLQQIDKSKLTQALLKQSLSLAITLQPEDETYDMIHAYVKNSQNHNFGIKILDIVRLFRSADTGFDYDPAKYRRLKCRYMLWHGCPNSAVGPILLNGLQRPLPKRQMFGTGIYFADRASKSAQYCVGGSGKTPTPYSTGYLFLCDVFVGKWYLANNAHTEYTQAPTYTKKSGRIIKTDSVKVMGKNVPDEMEEERRRYCTWPLGKTVRNRKFDDYLLQYNEFIIFDPNHVKLKYLVKVEFQPNPC